MRQQKLEKLLGTLSYKEKEVVKKYRESLKKELEESFLLDLNKIKIQKNLLKACGKEARKYEKAILKNEFTIEKCKEAIKILRKYKRDNKSIISTENIVLHEILQLILENECKKVYQRLNKIMQTAQEEKFKNEKLETKEEKAIKEYEELEELMQETFGGKKTYSYSGEYESYNPAYEKNEFILDKLD